MRERCFTCISVINHVLAKNEVESKDWNITFLQSKMKSEVQTPIFYVMLTQ